MDFSSKPIWVILGVPLLALAAYGLWGESEKQKFDRLETGMTAAQVQAILFPPSGGKYGRMHQTEVRDNENLTLNNCMELTIRGGLLVDKQWTGTAERKKFVAQTK